MKKILTILILFVSLSAYAKNNLPIMLKVKSNFNLEAPILDTFRSGAEDSLTAQGYVLISKQQQDEALMEQSKQRKSDCYDDACLVDTGKMMAAQMIFIIDINKTENQYIFKVRLLDLETGSIKRTVTKIYKERLTDVDKLLSFSKELTNESLGVNVRKGPVALFKVGISSFPLGASLYIDGKFIGKTPSLASVEKGVHQFKVSLDKYEDLVYKEDIQQDLNKTVKLTPRVYTIEVVSNPAKAKVFYKGEYKGESPLKLKVGNEAVFNEIKLEKKGYYKFVHKVKESDLDKKLTVDLIELEKYNCKINVTPEDAKIILKNVYFGETEFKSGVPQKLYKGLYSMKIVKDGYSLPLGFDYYIELSQNTERNVRMLRSYTRYLKFQTVTDVTIAKNLSYLSVGAGTELFNFTSDNQELTLLGVNVYRNMADNYFYTDVYNNIKWEVVNGLSFGINISAILGDDVKTLAGGLLVEYRYVISDVIMIKLFFRGGVTYFDEKNADTFDFFYMTSGLSISSVGF